MGVPNFLNQSARDRSRLPLIVLASAFAVAVVVLVLGAVHSRFHLSNIDGISYISLAEQYANGEVGTAINAYWSPMISWAMAPLLALGVPAILSFNLVSVLGAIFTIGVGSALVWRITRGGFWSTGLFLGMTTVFATGNLFNLTPDMLVVGWVVGFIGVLVRLSRLSWDSPHRQWVTWALTLGLVGGVGYFIKLYLLPVFVVAVAVWLLIRVFDESEPTRRVIVSRLLVALALSAGTMIVVAAPWVTALSTKYGYFTVGSSFSVNVGPKFNADPGGESSNEYTLWAPPNQNAVSFGEDRTVQADDNATVPSDPIAQRVGYYLSQRLLALPFYLERISSIAPFAAGTMFLVVLAAVFGKFRLKTNSGVMVAAIVWSVYFAGYAAITSAASNGGNSRYYWPLLVISLFASCLLLAPLGRKFLTGARQWQKVAAIVLVAILPMSVVWQHGLGKAAPFSTVPALGNVLYLVTPAHESAAQALAGELSRYVSPGSKIVGSNYRFSLQLAYFLGAQIYGRAEQGYDIRDPRFRSVLRENGIDFYFQFTPADQSAPTLDELGRTVASYRSTMPCADTQNAPAVDCILQVIKIFD